MSDAPKAREMAQPPEESEAARRRPLWTGTGLCCEAQGDGVPCQGTDGECETCGRALLPQTDTGSTPSAR
jgi:hypothetical protein